MIKTPLNKISVSGFSPEALSSGLLLIVYGADFPKKG
jgi:hypothetical protein